MRSPRLWPLALVPAGICLVSAGASCGNSGQSEFDAGRDATGDVHVPKSDGSPRFGGDTGPVDAAGTDACTGLECQAQIDNCAGKGKPLTSISGVVYDPAGVLPLYDVYVYVPNTKPDPINPGNPSCSQCEAYASGGPIIGTLTKADGSFTLVKGAADRYGVPSGNVTVVVQTGKWRKQVQLTVDACKETKIHDPSNPKDKLRLPANSSEGDMPLIAFTSGCDPAECFLRHLGIDDSEFVPPSSTPPPAWPAVAPPGTGHVHFYTAQDNQGGGPASSVTGGNTVDETYAWWTDPKNLLKYDIVFNACECNANERGAGAYAAMDAYLNGGGRLYTTHYYYNWFAPSPPATADLSSVAEWSPKSSGDMGTETDSIDQSFPKGVAFAEWLQDNKITSTLGSITLADWRDNLNGLSPAGCEATKTCLSTQWIYQPTGKEPRYISFNTPVAAAPDAQCGRAVFSDVHLSGASNNAIFPGECTNPDPDGSHVTNEKALEFLFFDLSSCVQDDNMPPAPPPGSPPK